MVIMLDLVEESDRGVGGEAFEDPPYLGGISIF